jgi:SAM-dependent methyltransferase
MSEEKYYLQLLKRTPYKAPILLPTEKIPLKERISGVEKVIDISENRWAREYVPKLKALRKKFKDTERCFVIGNGPSLNKTDLNLIKSEVSFAVNGIFLKFEKTDFRPTFYVVEDHLVAEDRHERINALQGFTKLFPIYLSYCLNDDKDTIFYNHRPRVSYPHGFDFSTDASKITYTGCTVLYSCLQLAVYFGIKNIYLIGVDLNYKIPETTKKTTEYNIPIFDMPEDDPNHFHRDYFGKGFRWHDPQEEKMKEAFSEAKRVCQKIGVKIYNATIGGNLNIFPRIAYYDLFKTSEKTKSTMLQSYQSKPARIFLDYIRSDSQNILEIGSDHELQVVNYLAKNTKAVVYGLNPDKGFGKPLNDLRPRVKVFRASGNDIPLQDNSVDGIFSIATLEHVLDLPGLLRECLRILRPGGIFYTDFGPIWSCAVGHHVFAKSGDKEARFWKSGRNPVPDYAHLLLNEDEMREELAQGPCDPSLIEPIIDWIYHSSAINRIFFHDYRRIFLESGFRVKFIRARSRPQSAPISHEIKKKLEEKYGTATFHNHAFIEFLGKKPESFRLVKYFSKLAI